MSESLDTAKDTATDVKDQATGLAARLGDTLPAGITSKIEDVIPGAGDNDGH